MTISGISIIIRRIKAFFVATAGTPVSTPDLTSAKVDLSKSNPMCSSKEYSIINEAKAILKEQEERRKRILKALAPADEYINRFVILLAKLFKLAIFFIVLAHFIPELREQLPSLYRVFDLIISCVEWSFSVFWQLIENLSPLRC